MRTKQITLCGKLYWIAFSAQSQMHMEAIRNAPDFDLSKRGAEFAFETLVEELRAGYRYAQLTGQPANEPPTREDLADMIGEDDILAVMGDINEVAVGVRNVQAKPPKKKADSATSAP